MPDRVVAEGTAFPRRFGRYTLLGRLGVGGMSEVFLADQPATTLTPACRVVIKQLKERLASGDDFAQMSADEARISSALVHRNIVRVHDFGRVGDTLYLAMEYVPGRTLEQLLKDVGGPLPPSLACHLVAEVCSGLGHAHGKTDARGQPLQIVHRDVNPPNLLIADDGRVMITDFGIATAAHRSYQTVAGVIKGKYAYMAPEQAAGLPADRRTDLFCLGIVLYQVLTGTLPFQGKSSNEILRKVLDCQPVPPSQVNPRIPAQLEAVVMKALAKDPSGRFQEAGDMERQLRDFARQSTNPGSQDIALFARSASMQGEYSEAAVSVQDAPLTDHTEGRAAAPQPKEGDPVTTLGLGSVTQAAGGGQTVIRQRPPAEVARSRAGLVAGSAVILVAAVGAAFWGASTANRKPVAAAEPPPVTAASEASPVPRGSGPVTAASEASPVPTEAAVTAPLVGHAAHSAASGAGRPAVAQPSATPAATPMDARDALEAIPTIAVPAPTRPPGKGGLTVLVDDWGEVSIDGERISQTAPFTDLAVPAGLHRISVRSSSGVRDFDVNIGRGKTTTIDATFH